MKKTISKSMAWILSVVMIFGMFVIIPIRSANAYTSHSRDEAVAWARSKIGSKIDMDGYPTSNPYQCVDLIKAYYQYLGVSPVLGNGCDYSHNSLPSGWTRIQNTPTFVPEPGDIVVWTDTGWKNGHVAIFLSGNTSSFTSIDQNWPQGSAVKEVSHNYKYVWGVIRPDFTPIPIPDPDPDPIPTPNPVDLGTEFYAYIVNDASGKIIAEDSGNVVLQSKNDNSNQQWKFEKQDNNCYKIINVATGKCLDVDNAGTNFGTNIQTLDDNGTNAQRWYISERSGHYALQPIYANNLSLDIDGGDTSDGRNIHVWESNNTPAQLFSIQKFNKVYDYENPNVYNATISKVSSRGYRVTCNVDDNQGITKVLFPTWTENNGQDDIIYYEGTILGNTASVYVSTADHNNEKGTYITHIYAYDQAGNTGFNGVGITLRDDNEPYPLRETDYNGHRYVMYLADMSWTNAQNWCNAHGGYLATVTNEEEWNTIKWMVTFDHAPCFWLGAESTSGSWKWVTGEPFTYADWGIGEPNGANESEFYLGTYEGTLINAYKWNDFPNNAEQVGCFIFEEPLDKTPPTVTNPTISRVSSKGYQVTCNISDDHGVKKVLFPTWTDNNGQDDVIYYEGVISGNTATVYIPTSEHNNEKGAYITHIYAYDAEGNSGFAGTGINIVDDEPYPIKTAEYNGHNYTMYLADMTWTEAQAWCEKNGGYLATVTSQAEWDTIKRLVTHNHAPCCWLGAESTSGSWKWVTGEEFTYSDWWTDQPDCAGGREFYLGTYEGSIINAYRWNDFTEATDLIGCFVMEKPIVIPIENSSVLSADNIKLGTYITVNASATGGTGNYTYAVYYKKSSSTSWTKTQDFSTNSKVKIKPAKAVKYDVLVKVKDSSGKIAKKTFTVNVVEALKNNSTVSSGNIGFGDTVTIKAKATGGVGPYSYAVYYKKASADKWTTLQKYSDKTTVTFKPASAVKYDVMVKVQDSRGVIVKKTLTVNVTKPENTSELSADTVKFGNAVTVSCSAKGGSGYYQYAVLYKKTSSEKWTTKQNYSSTSTVSIKPAAKATYDICVKVKDSLGNIAKKYFTVTVTK